VIDTSADKYREEFKDLGVARVRNELVLRRWHKDKLAAARHWVERQDVSDWVSTHRDAPAKPRASSSKKWIGYAVAAVGLIFAAERFLRMMGHF
jgi:hypothetical protein